MITVVCHDAGGAEIVSAYVRRNPQDYLFCLAGPAKAIFERKLGALPLQPVPAALAASNRLITGTGWQSELEWQALGLAREMGVPSVAVLDHWANYQARFIRNSITHLPDELWVGDPMARDMAISCFPGLRVQLLDNPYLLDLKAELAALPVAANRPRPAVLYVCEPIQDHVSQSGEVVTYGYNEFDALRFFLANVNEVVESPAQIVVRPHPAEPAGKYLGIMAEFPHLPVAPGSGQPLISEVAASEVVVGCESMAMIVALAAGKRVVSSIPPGGRQCALPHSEIERLRDLVRQP